MTKEENEIQLLLENFNLKVSIEVLKKSFFKFAEKERKMIIKIAKLEKENLTLKEKIKDFRKLRGIK